MLPEQLGNKLQIVESKRKVKEKQNKLRTSRYNSAK